MARNLNDAEREKIKRIFNSGCGINETARRCGVNKNSVRHIVGSNARAFKDAIILGRKNHPPQLTENGRQRLSDNGKKQCQKSGKIWTKPEKQFKILLNSCGIGVSFPEYIRDIFGLQDDKNATVCFQYPIQRYICDFVDVNNKIVYCVNGDFWHANPILYDACNLTNIQKHNIHHDIQRKNYLEKLGYMVIGIWESDINWNPELVKERIRAVSSEAAASGLHPEGRDFEILTAHSDWSATLKSLWFKKPKERNFTIKQCQCCGKEFKISAQNKLLNSKRKYCSVACAAFRVRKVINRPSKEQLQKDLETMSYCAVGRKYKVSDNTVRKWVK